MTEKRKSFIQELRYEAGVMSDSGKSFSRKAAKALAADDKAAYNQYTAQAEVCALNATEMWNRASRLETFITELRIDQALAAHKKGA